MVERQDYLHHSPQELNLELARLYEQMPYHVLYGSNPHGSFSDIINSYHQIAKDKMETRRRSEHKEILLSSVRELLKYSQASEFFNEKILKELKYSYDIGIKDPTDDLSEAFSSEFEFILDSQSEAGGIFNRERAQYIEFMAFESECIAELEVRRISRKHAGKAFDLSDSDLDSDSVNILKGDSFNRSYLLNKRLDEWFKSYKSHYGLPEEPGGIDKLNHES